MFLFRKFGGPPFAKSKIQRRSPNFIHYMYLIFEPSLLRRNFWGIPLRRNVYAMRFFDLSFGSQISEFLRPVHLASLAQSIFFEKSYRFLSTRENSAFFNVTKYFKMFLIQTKFCVIKILQLILSHNFVLVFKSMQDLCIIFELCSNCLDVCLL